MRHDFHCFSSALRRSRALISIHIRKIYYEKVCTKWLSHGFPCVHSTHASIVVAVIANHTFGRWSYGANRVQVDADVKVLSEFLSYLHTDTVRVSPAISSLSPVQSQSRGSRMYYMHSPRPYPDSLVDYATRLRSINLPLRLLTENEVFRLMVWANPTNDPKRGSDQVGTTAATLFEVRLIQFGHVSLLNNVQTSWVQLIRTVWQINPAIAVHLPERFKSPVVRNEVSKLVRSSTIEALDVPEALPFLLGDRLDPKFRRDFRVTAKARLTCSPLISGDSVSYFMGACSTHHCQHAFRTTL